MLNSLRGEPLKQSRVARLLKLLWAGWPRSEDDYLEKWLLVLTCLTFARTSERILHKTRALMKWACHFNRQDGRYNLQLANQAIDTQCSYLWWTRTACKNIFNTFKWLIDKHIPSQMFYYWITPWECLWVCEAINVSYVLSLTTPEFGLLSRSKLIRDLKVV